MTRLTPGPWDNSQWSYSCSARSALCSLDIVTCSCARSTTPLTPLRYTPPYPLRLPLRSLPRCAVNLSALWPLLSSLSRSCLRSPLPHRRCRLEPLHVPGAVTKHSDRSSIPSSPVHRDARCALHRSLPVHTPARPLRLCAAQIPASVLPCLAATYVASARRSPIVTSPPHRKSTRV